MFSWLRTTRNSEIREFAQGLAEQIVRRYPPEVDQRPGRRPSVNRLTRIIEDVCEKSVEFQRQKGLGWLGKARLGNHFRWALADAGYSKEFVDFATEAVVVYISRPQARAADPT